VSERSPDATVVIVDDDAAVRESLATLVGAAGFSTRCHESGEALFQCELPEGPACLLLDLRMPGASGIDVQHELRSHGWDGPIIFLTGHAEVQVAVRALKSGAADFIVKSEFEPAELIARIRDCVDHHAERLERKQRRADVRKRIEQLTQRELEVACLAADGMTNQAIGIELEISERTVEIHRGRAMKKLKLRTAANLVRLHQELLDYSTKH
jgi:RNA polymerase sigma factor (sigma-70 family)